MPSPRRTLSLGFLFLLLIAGTVFVFTAFQLSARPIKPEPVVPRDTPVAPTTTNPQPTTPTTTQEWVSALTEYSNVAVPSDLSILFSEEVGSVTTTHRWWPVVAVYEKRGTEPTKQLFQVGKLGEYPHSVRLSPDKQFLLVDLESKLQRYTFATEKLEDLFIPQQGIGGVAFSPDGKELFIWDQKYPAVDQRYYARRLDLSTGRDVLVKQGMADAMVDPSWLPNNTIILHQAMGEVAAPWRLSLSTGEFVQVKEGLMSGPMSQSGELMALPTDFIGDACNDFSGDTESKFDLVKTDSGNTVTTIDGRGRAVRFYAISPDDRQVLYSLYTPFTDREQCEGNHPVEDAYLLTIATGRRERVSDPQALVWRWYSTNDARVRMKYDQDTMAFTLLVDGQPLVESTRNFTFIGTR